MKIFLHGALKKLSSDPISIKSNRWDLIFRGLESQFPDFRSKFKESDQYVLAIKTDSGIKLLSDDDLQYPIQSDELHLIPSIDGSGVELVMLAAAIGTQMAVQYAMITTLTAVLINIAVGYIVASMAPKPKIGGISDGVDKRDSFYFSGAKNTTEPGTPIPLVYGEFIVGSVVASIGIETTDLYKPES